MHNLAKIATSALLGTGLVLGSGSAFAAAPAKAQPRAATGQSQVKNAELYLKVLISGLQSKNVEGPVKGALVGCLYNNSLGRITESMDKVIAENPGKIHRDNPGELLSVMVRICGYKPDAAAKGGR
ncbi:hypothetical protein [Novosphingobium mangrovi (ex Huang et al. 2023)]|uniref:DUF732 domain-containing protein n=1 Tax=Novosphingobium mangrovi (ex Huang et al. 2023) TaxID=2976432 RepID=A0ABT2I5G0_9SPHN|nr:hypothetical protein [Novosphingobium mangrovi (ex Huang et al. 2023)]MCT2400042.1 hypothetical protein [Novosphingobium mangrovi (ex Huang et al. 2023)]